MTSERGARELVLYHTAGCHLCELAEAIALPLAAAAGVRLRLVDIAASDALMERYGTRIPVLRNPAALGEEIGWPFDEAAVRGLLAGIS
jgi:Glutaredoxin-like domain (DUF836)